jgi:methyl-accepting chemotaxis protein
LRQLCDSVNAQTRETRRSMDHIATMLKDRTMTRDQDMVRDMDRLQERLHSVTDGLQEMVATMEQMQHRLQERPQARP